MAFCSTQGSELEVAVAWDKVGGTTGHLLVVLAISFFFKFHYQIGINLVLIHEEQST